MKQLVAKIIIFLLIFLTFVNSIGCKNEDRIPYVPVNFDINLNNPEFYELTTPNNFVYVTGGVKGIIIYHAYLGQYNAYERNCPYKPYSENSFLMVDSTLTFLVCKSCDSKFLLFDGSLISGPAEYPVLQYNTWVDNDRLYVNNDIFY